MAKEREESAKFNCVLQYIQLHIIYVYNKRVYVCVFCIKRNIDLHR